MRSSRTPLTRNQVNSFLAAWGGWVLDGMDSFIYALVLVPASRELLPRSGIPATTANIGYYGGMLFALFLVGWGLALLWGPLVSLSVVATGNHYVFDIVAGMVAAAIGYGLGKLVAKGTTALV